MPRRSRREQPDAAEEVQRLEKRMDPFKKTKMCKFNILGMCTRGENCQFAHDRVELNAMPDLFRTKLCKRLINTGECDDPACKYAHNKEELRDHPVSRVDRSVRIGGQSREDQPPYAGYPSTAGVVKVGLQTRRQDVQDTSSRAPHESMGQMGGRLPQFSTGPAWGDAQKQSGMYGMPQHPPMGGNVGGGSNHGWRPEVSLQDFCNQSNAAPRRPKNRLDEWEQITSSRDCGFTSPYYNELSQYSTPPSSMRNIQNEAIVNSPERWPQGNLHLASGDDFDYDAKGTRGDRSCSSDTDAKSGFGSDNSSVTLPPDHLLGGGDQFRQKQSSYTDDRFANGKTFQAVGHHAASLRVQNGQMAPMPMPSIVQEAEVAAGPYVACQNGAMNTMNMNCYTDNVQTTAQGGGLRRPAEMATTGGYPMGSQPPTHVLGLAEMLGAGDCSVKNTFLNFASNTPKLRNVQTAAGRLDLMGQE